MVSSIGLCVRVLFICAIFTIAVVNLAKAAGLGVPAGEIILDVTGTINQHNSSDGDAAFDMAMLKSLPATTIHTATPWFDGVHALTGVRLADLLRAVGASGSKIKAVALNDYMVDIPAADALNDNVIVAYAFDGQEMSVRDKGPLWVIYPLTDRPDINTPETQSKMIWQLKALTIN
jgi:hypothetical protein